MQQAFTPLRDARSSVYKAGVRAALEYHIDGKHVFAPYAPGSVEFDAFHSGLGEGHLIWRHKQ